jgi:peptidoglycan/xylan/chitin deacetylase (PgdA/CDA1 family)
MHELLRSFQPVPLLQLADGTRTGSLPDRAVSVTFDDGYLDNLETASPILCELGIPATFFIPSQALSGGGAWWDTLAEVFLGPCHLPPRLTLEWAGETLDLPTRTAVERRASHDLVFARIRTAAAAPRDEVMRTVKEWAGFGGQSAALTITRQHLRDLASRPGHSIGGHTEHHLSLPAQTAAVIAAEVQRNKALLEEVTGREVSCFAYPFGEHDQASVAVVRAAGYAAAVTCVEDAVSASTDRLLLPRLVVGSAGPIQFRDALTELLSGASRPSARHSWQTEGGNVDAQQVTSAPAGQEEPAGAPYLSVVIVCRDAGARLDASVQRVLDQTCDDLEIIIVDEGSTDVATRHLFASYQRPRTTVIRLPSGSGASATNAAIAACRASVIAFLNAGDLVEPGFARACVERLRSEPSAAFVTCYGSHGPYADYPGEPPVLDLAWLLSEQATGFPMVVRRDVLLAMGAFHASVPSGFEAWNIAVSLLERGLSGALVPEHLIRSARAAGGTQGHYDPRLISSHAISYRTRLADVLDRVEARILALEAAAARPESPDTVSAGRAMFYATAARTLLMARSFRWLRPLRRLATGVRRTRTRRSEPPYRIAVIVTADADRDALWQTLDSVWFLAGHGGQIILVHDPVNDPLATEVLGWYVGGGLHIVARNGRPPGAARARAMTHVRAPLVFSIHAGDVVEPAVLQAAMERLEGDAEAAFVLSGLLDPRTGFTWLPDSATLEGVVGCPRVPMPIVRCDALERAGGPSEGLDDIRSAAWDLALRLTDRGERGLLLRENLVTAPVASLTDGAGVTNGSDSRPAGSRVIRAVVAQHPGVFDRCWAAALTGLDDRRRRIEEHLRPAAGPGQSPPAGVTADWGSMRRLEPVSQVWGIDRGQPVDRYYIERFLDQHRQDIRGTVLEVKDPGYTRAFGDGVQRSEVVDIASGNPAATIVGDLRDRGTLPPSAFDCFILTQTLHIIYDMPAVVANAAAALRPGGVLLATLPCVSRVDYESGLLGDCWRVTPASARKLFEDAFGSGNVEVHVAGNVLVCCSFLMGLAAADLTSEELEHQDPYFPLIVCVRARIPPSVPPFKGVAPRAVSPAPSVVDGTER